MEGAIPALPLGVDPLIAEAKRRGRRRRMWFVAAVVAAATVSAALTITLRPTGLASVPARPAWLHDATARGTLVSLNRRTAVAEFRISCGWHTGPGGHATTKVRPGLYRLQLGGGLFNVESGVDPKVPGSGVANEMRFWRWERFARPGLRFWFWAYRKAYVSDGPSTDICGGVFG